MTKSALTILAVTSTLALGGMVQANAATITASYDFTASGFTPSGISPVDPWTGSFTITFDPTGGLQSGALAFSSNLPASYGTFTFVSAAPGLTIGDDCDAFGCGSAGGLNTALLQFFPVTASGGLTVFQAIITSNSTNLISATQSGTVTPIAPSTPLPAALPLFATGLGALGLLGWRRKRKARAGVA